MTNLRADLEETDSTVASSQVPAASVATATVSAAAPRTPVATADTSRYDFVIRVAAFKLEEQADALRLRLEDAGMRTRLVREKAQLGTWHFVHILYRGTIENMQKIRDGLPRFGVRDSLLISRMPVS